MKKINNVSTKYVAFGVSAMEAAVSVGLLRGRPWGGTAILVKNSLASSCSDVTTLERTVALRIFDLLFINVYMPCEDGSVVALNTLHETLANVSNIIELSTAQLIVFGGDINVNITGKSPHAFISNYLFFTDLLLKLSAFCQIA